MLCVWLYFWPSSQVCENGLMNSTAAVTHTFSSWTCTVREEDGGGGTLCAASSQQQKVSMTTGKQGWRAKSRWLGYQRRGLPGGPAAHVCWSPEDLSQERVTTCLWNLPNPGLRTQAPSCSWHNSAPNLPPATPSCRWAAPSQPQLKYKP